MTQEQFFKKVIELYREARKNTYLSKKITRGRSHSISSRIEDLFAFFLDDKVSFDHIYIDQPISLPNKIQVYPDLIVVRNGKARHFVDLKTDLGWKRDQLAEYAREKRSLLKKISGQLGLIRVGEEKESKSLQIASSITYNVVIVSGKNINPLLLSKQLKEIDSLKPHVEVFVLSSGIHPNRRHQKGTDWVLGKILIHRESFERLLKKLNR